jgi:DNA-binding GntR family transcriptional regulator
MFPRKPALKATDMNKMIETTAKTGGTAAVPGAMRDEQIHQAIYSAIVEHLIPPGTKLAEDTLGEIYGVSRTRIRKVLIRLAAENIVTLIRNRGASVVRPSVKDAREVFATRRILESKIIAAVAKKPTDSEILELRGFSPRERQAHEQNDRRAQIKLSGEFHMKLAEFMGNQTIIDILRNLVSRTSLIIAVYETRRGSCCQFDEHGELVELIARRDVKGAVARMEQHLLEIEGSLDLVGQRSLQINLQEVLGGARAAMSAPSETAATVS